MNTFDLKRDCHDFLRKLGRSADLITDLRVCCPRILASSPNGVGIYWRFSETNAINHIREKCANIKTVSFRLGD